MISLKIQNSKGISNIIAKVENEKLANSVKMTQMAILLRAAIQSKLLEALGSKSRHFDVKVEPGIFGVKITLRATDTVGGFIYSGTSSHDIYSSSTAMPMPDGGFARSVNHPGTEPMKDKIDKAIMMALLEVKAIL